LIDRNTPSDPRLRERRGDLVGRSALLFALVVLLAVGTAGWYILDSRPSPGSAAASASPAGSSSASPSSSASVTPTPTPRRSPSPSPSPSAPPAVPISAAGTPADLLVDGQPAGTVTASVPKYRPRLAGQGAPEGRRFAVVQIAYAATAPLTYRPADWLVVDADGGRHPVAAVQPKQPLGEGSLEAGAAASGPVAFAVPANVDVRAIVLRPQDAGRDLLAFRVP